MRKNGSFKSIICFAVLGAALCFAGCSNKITEEQLTQLKNLRAQEKSLNESILQKKDAKSRLEQELSTRKNELKDCNEQKQYVLEKLQNWPNVWPTE